MKKRHIIVIYAIILICLNVTHAIEVEGEINGTWRIEDSPVIVQDTIYIQQNDSLLIEAGVIVRFAGPFSLQVGGALTAEGTQEDSVVFESGEEDGSWRGIRAESGSEINLNFCIISNCMIGDNETLISGGAIYCGSARLDISNSRIRNNSCSRWGGALCLMDSCRAVIRNNEFSENDALEGGAIYIGSLVGADALIHNNVFKHNTAANGAAIVVRANFFNENWSAISGNTFIYNNAENTGGAILIGRDTIINVYNNLLAFNSAADYGGGAYFDQFSNVEFFYSNTIAFNESETGGGLCIISDNGQRTTYNNIFWGNIAEQGSQLFFYDYLEEIILSYCAIEGDWPQELSDHIIHNDPLFVDTENLNFHLSENSPCIDSGAPEFDPDPDGTNPDIGAFYFHQRDIKVLPDSIIFETHGTEDSSGIHIENTGRTDLTVFGLEIIPGDQAFSTSVEFDEIVLEPDSGFSVWIYFIPQLSGVYSALLHIESDDPDEAIIEIPLMATSLKVQHSNEAIPVNPRITSLCPNPFNSQMSISYELERALDVELSIIDLAGREVAKLQEGGKSLAGSHTATWDASSVPSGVYFARLSAGGEVKIAKVVCLR